MPREQPSPAIIVYVKYRQRVVRTSVLEGHDEAAVLVALGLLTVRPLAVSQNDFLLLLRKGPAFVREKVIMFCELLTGHAGHRGFFRHSGAGVDDGGDDNQIHSSDF